jgi:hypothetical protein
MVECSRPAPFADALITVRARYYCLSMKNVKRKRPSAVVRFLGSRQRC